VLHRVKARQDVFLVCNQNDKGNARQFKFRATAAGEPECWDAVRNEVTAIPFRRTGVNVVEFSLSLEPLETVMLVFQPKRQPRPWRIEPSVKPIHEPLLLTRDPNPPVPKLPPLDANRPKTISPVAAADPFRGRCVIPADVDLAKCRFFLEMDGLPDDSAAVTVNGMYSGGMIGRPLRLDITHCVKPGENTVIIEPLAPKSAKLVFYAAAELEDTLLTKPFVVRGTKLFVNTDAAKGILKLEVLDGHKKALAVSEEVVGDQPRAGVPWKSGDFSSLTGQTVSLRFTLRQAKLYSFWLDE